MGVGKSQLTPDQIRTRRYSMNSTSKHQPWTDVAVFEDLTAGQTVATLLNQQGFPARAYDDKFLRRFLFLRPPGVTLRVQVHAGDLERAQNFLHTSTEDHLRAALHCPDCGSLRISYPQMTRKFILPTIVLHLGILLRFTEHQCYCENCHCLWELPGKLSRPTSAIAKQAA